MNGIRRFSKGIAVFLLFLVLLGLPAVISIQMTLNTPNAVKNTLAESGIYDRVAASDMLLENSHLSSMASSNEMITAALSDSISPSYVKNSSEKLVDAIYAYVHGDMATLELAVDVGDVKAQFANNVAMRVKQKFDSLPVCTELKIPSTSIESLLEATCTPVGVSSQQASEDAKTEIMNTALFSNDRLDLAGLVGARESSLVALLTDLRTAYPYFIALVYGLPALGLVLAAIILFLSSPRRRGIKSLANTLLSAGIINGVMALIATWLTEVFFMGDSIPNDSQAASGFENLLPNLLSSFAGWWLGGAGVLLGLSILLYIILALTRPPEPEPTSQPQSPAPPDQLRQRSF